MGNWLTDLNDGETCQLVVTSFLQSRNLLPKVVIQASGYQPSYDVQSPNGTKLEIKFDILATLTGNLAIEFERKKRTKDGDYFKEPSGILTSHSDFWAVMYMADRGFFMKTWDVLELEPQLLLLKRVELYDYIQKNNCKVVPMGDNKLTSGYIIPVDTLKNMSWCEIMHVPLETESMDNLINRLIAKLKKVNISLLKKYRKLYT